jgi:hypothetical protein
MLEIILQYVVVPISGLLVWMFKRQLDHHTDIEKLKVHLDSNKLSHDREMLEIRRTTDAILTKLNDIEAYLRK